MMGQAEKQVAFSSRQLQRQAAPQESWQEEKGQSRGDQDAQRR
jgi:hypothetical protein